MSGNRKQSVKDKISLWQNINRDTSKTENFIETNEIFTEKKDVKTEKPTTTKPTTTTTTKPTITTTKTTKNQTPLNFTDLEGVKHQIMSGVVNCSSSLSTNKATGIVNKIPTEEFMLKESKSFSCWEPTHGRDTLEYIEVEVFLSFSNFKFPEPGYVQGIEIYENFHPGAVITISACVYQPGGNKKFGKKDWVKLWMSNQLEPESLSGTRKFSPTFNVDPKKQVFSSYIRIDISLKRLVTYYQIAGVCLLTTKEPSLRHPLPSFSNKMMEFSDFKIIVKDGEKKKEFPTSRLLLATMSPMFSEKLLKENELREMEFEFDIIPFEFVYFYLNYQKLQFEEMTVIDVYIIADKLSLHELKKALLSQFSSFLDGENFSKIWEKIKSKQKSGDLSQLKSVIDHYIESNFNYLMHTDVFDNVSESFLKYYLKKGTLNVDEYPLCLALHDWNKKNNKPMDNLHDLIQYGMMVGNQWETIQSLTGLKKKPNNKTGGRKFKS
jgi:hypothetical protein